MALKDFVNGEALNSFTKMFKNYILNELLGGKILRYVTQEEYDNLSDSEKNDDSIVWNITNPPAEQKIVYLTQEEYDALNTLDPDTLYIIE